MNDNSRADFFALASAYLQHLAPIAPAVLQTGAAVADALFKAERDAEQRRLPEASK
jgi:hypothetical protein